MREWILATVGTLVCFIIPVSVLSMATFGEKTAEKVLCESSECNVFSQYEADRTRLYDLEISFLETIEVEEPSLWEQLPELTRNEWDSVRVPSLELLNDIYDMLDGDCNMADALDLDEWSVIGKIDQLRAEFERKYGEQ